MTVSAIKLCCSGISVTVIVTSIVTTFPHCISLHFRKLGLYDVSSENIA